MPLATLALPWTPRFDGLPFLILRLAMSFLVSSITKTVQALVTVLYAPAAILALYEAGIYVLAQSYENSAKRAVLEPGIVPGEVEIAAWALILVFLLNPFPVPKTVLTRDGLLAKPPWHMALPAGVAQGLIFLMLLASAIVAAIAILYMAAILGVVGGIGFLFAPGSVLGVLGDFLSGFHHPVAGALAIWIFGGIPLGGLGLLRLRPLNKFSFLPGQDVTVTGVRVQ